MIQAPLIRSNFPTIREVVMQQRVAIWSPFWVRCGQLGSGRSVVAPSGVQDEIQQGQQGWYKLRQPVTGESSPDSLRRRLLAVLWLQFNIPFSYPFYKFCFSAFPVTLIPILPKCSFYLRPLCDTALLLAHTLFLTSPFPSFSTSS